MVRNLSLALVLALGACGSARVISRTQTTGIIELSGDRGKAMQQANDEMTAHCGANNWVIVDEADEPVGNTGSGAPGAAGSQSTSGETVRRIHYQCNDAGAQQPGPAAPAPAAPAPAPTAPPG